MNFDGILFFPVTPFGGNGAIDHDLLAQHVERGVAAGAGGVFPACGTGEYHALSAGEAASVGRACRRELPLIRRTAREQLAGVHEPGHQGAWAPQKS